MLLVVSSSGSLYASGHGPVFGAATPTLGKGGWSFDQAWMGQVIEGPVDTSALLRSMISVGITEKLQISGSLPIPLSDSNALPSGRMMAMMSGNPDLESLLGWRFQTRPIGDGARLESTVYVGGLLPLDSQRGESRPRRQGFLADQWLRLAVALCLGGSHVYPSRGADGDQLVL